MGNWIELSTLEYKEVWDRIYDAFKFEPGMSDFPSFEVPNPFITYDVSKYLNVSVDLDTYDEIYNDLEEKSLIVFQELTQKNEYMYALDWQHPGYWINPRLEFPKSEFDEWTVPIFPNGDYYFFIHKNFEWGLLGHPWERTITIFGKELIKVFEKHQPKMFQKILRQG
ncbi:DUF2716 domain-containing protein [Peribacillus butanolivorans]|uniref:DUF2716 domain-containing protein n=1 Tax=Peribacillus butanolivorans TaxID=421767 RepID=UPI00207D305C|nr:DUF2716 domain-containing protein [Peribacillus butanolivorans]MCO0600445.1 DUF2716 domain-containing protein [Peribacillus butanolivorans]